MLKLIFHSYIWSSEFLRHLGNFWPKILGIREKESGSTGSHPLFCNKTKAA